MNIIFLDFDGPMFPERTILYDPRNNELYTDNVFSLGLLQGSTAQRWFSRRPYVHMCPSAVGIINALAIDFDCSIVVSSSWRRFFCKADMQRLFDLNGITVPLHDKWHIGVNGIKGEGNRADLVNDWISETCCDDYVIIDDPWSGSDFDLSPVFKGSERVIMVDPEEGLMPMHHHQILKVWTNVKY